MKINYAVLYGITFGVFILLDGIWLGAVAKNLYATQLKGLMTDNVKWGAAILFYVLFIVGLIYFVLNPALHEHSVRLAAQRGALFGFFTYATYDLTNYATLKGFPLTIVTVDLLWGTLVSLLVSSFAYMIYTKLV